MSNDLINCGTLKVQKLYRLSIWKTAVKKGIKEGEDVEVFIKKVRKNETE